MNQARVNFSGSSQLKAFDLTPANIKEQAKLLAAELKNIDEKETKKAAAQ